ncbi:acyltransferase family protein [Lysinibacillus capsici]|uniref:acyltransferase family protein n=1 Tax=Lysinibacillus capsici TaxID=2115968 RepID=UPI00325F97C1
MKEKINYLDGVRGFAALVVVFGHFMNAYYPALLTANINDSHFNNFIDVKLADTPFNLIFNGYFAVMIFFVLSGFVLTNKFFKSGENEFIISSAIRRYIRLVIPVAFSCTIAYLILKFSLFSNNELANYTKGYWYLPNYYNFEASLIDMIKKSFVDTFVYGVDTTSYNAVLWTMKIEFLGSLLVYSLALLIGKLRNRFIIYFLLIIFFAKTYYLAFLLGLIISDVYNNRTRIFNPIRNVYCTVLLILVGLFLGSYPQVVDTSNSLYNYLTFEWLGGRYYSMLLCHILGATILLIVLLNSKILQKIFSLKPFQFLGEISFSMYLLHFITLFSFSGKLTLFLSDKFGYHANFIISFLVSLILIFVISKIMTVYVDNNGVKFSRYVYNKFFKR